MFVCGKLSPVVSFDWSGLSMSYEKPTVTRYGTFRELTQVTFGNFLDQQAQGQGYKKYDGDQPVLHPTAS
jgi:hypothetical protein